MAKPAGRPRTWQLQDDAEERKITVRCPKDLWKDLQRIALEEDTSATALLIQALEQFINAKKKEVKPDKKAKK